MDIKKIDALRTGRSEHDNNLIDALLAGRVDRREFLRFGSLLGMSFPMLGIAGASGLINPGTARAQAQNATVRVAQIVPAAAIDPVKLGDGGGACVLSQVAETLAVSGKDLIARPLLAESWSPNKDGSVWTFKLRQGVKFHDGRTMNADDVVASINRIADPANGSNALSVLKGVLSKDGARKVDDYTVEFHLDAPNGSFPYFVSTDNYNSVILPKDYAGDFESKMIGTGPFKLESYTPKVAASFTRNEEYWGGPAVPARVELNFYSDYQPQMLALQGGEVDFVQQLPISQAAGVLQDPNIDVVSNPTMTHYQVHMRTDKEPFKDKRVRQAIALCLDRPALVNGLFKGKGRVGNDSPFGSAYPTTDTTVPQRTKDIAKAKELMAAAGMANGFEVTLTTMKYLEIPDYAVTIQNAVKEIGGKINLNIMDQGAYYGEAVYGKSPWLDSDMGITDYGHRGVPNVYLSAPLRSDGAWNSAHFSNKKYDSLVSSFVGALDIDAQKEQAGQIQRLLLDETPIIFAFFYDLVAAAKKGTTGIETTAMGHVFLRNAAVPA